MAMEYLLSLCHTQIYQSDVRQQQLLADRARKFIRDNAIDMQAICCNSVHIPSTRNPLFEACRVGYMDLVQAFLDCGANLNIMDEEGRTPLYVAMSSHRCKAQNILKLVQWGANVNLYKHGRVPLMCGFYGMDSEITKILIQHGANVNNVNLPSFCIVESLFALNSGMVMMAAGVRFAFENFREFLDLGKEIILAGLTPRTFYLSSKNFLSGNMLTEIMSDLWDFQHLCLILGFKVDLLCLQDSISDIQSTLQTSQDDQKTQVLKDRLSKFNWTKQFLSQPLPLTFLSRIAIRSYLVAPNVSRGKHIAQVISDLPLPQMARDFLAINSSNKSCSVLNR